MGSLSDTRIALIGAGNMGGAFLHGLLNEGLTSAQSLVVSDPLAERQAAFKQELGVEATASNLEAVAGAQIAILAVKPQVLPKVLNGLRGRVDPGLMVLSIVAGASIGTVREALGTQAVVRAMPNTPGQIGEGISVWTATPETTGAQREQARAIIGALGQEIYVEDEGYLDMATALSGSGPAYVFLFIEALTDAGVHMGFARPVAEKLALQTVRGAAVYAQYTGSHPAVLRNMVTSPGGTTAEALYAFERGGFRALVQQAVLAAYHRAQSLGGAKDE